MAGWLARSPPSETVAPGSSCAAVGGADQVGPFLVGPGPVVRPVDDDLVGRVGAGGCAVGDVDAGEMSVRAPATPSIVKRPCAGSNWPMPAIVGDGPRALEGPAAVEGPHLVEDARVALPVVASKTT